MSALYARLNPDAAKEVTRRGHNRVSATLETWEGKITVTLDRDGNFSVRIGDKHAMPLGTLGVASGNLNSEEARREAAGSYDIAS